MKPFFVPIMLACALVLALVGCKGSSSDTATNPPGSIHGITSWLFVDGNGSAGLNASATNTAHAP